MGNTFTKSKSKKHRYKNYSHCHNKCEKTSMYCSICYIKTHPSTSSRSQQNRTNTTLNSPSPRKSTLLQAMSAQPTQSPHNLIVQHGVLAHGKHQHQRKQVTLHGVINQATQNQKRIQEEVMGILQLLLALIILSVISIMMMIMCMVNQPLVIMVPLAIMIVIIIILLVTVTTVVILTLIMGVALVHTITEMTAMVAVIVAVMGDAATVMEGVMITRPKRKY